MNELIEKAKKIKCLISDIDGVLTNGMLYIDDHGVETKAFHVQDGMGLKLLMSAGIHVAVITTSKNPVVEHRMKQLGIEYYYTAQVNKQAAYQELKKTLTLQDKEIAYIGDDLPDLPLIKQVGFGVAVANAVKSVKDSSIWVTKQVGGHGAVRELCDLILEAQNKLDVALNGYFGL